LHCGTSGSGVDVGLIVVVREGLTDVFNFLLAQEPSRLTEAMNENALDMLLSAASRGYTDMLQAVLLAAERQDVSWPQEDLAEATAAAISFRHNDLARE